jgi:hypothetical protein
MVRNIWALMLTNGIQRHFSAAACAGKSPDQSLEQQRG